MPGMNEGAHPTIPLVSPTNTTNQPGTLNSLTGAMVRPGMPGSVGQALPAFQTPTLQVPARPLNPDEPVVPTNGFSTHEEAEKAFWYLLKKTAVTPDSTWENTIRAIITDPLYKSFNSMAERKESWQKVRIFPFCHCEGLLHRFGTVCRYAQNERSGREGGTHE
jgi:FF domain